MDSKTKVHYKHDIRGTESIIVTDHKDTHPGLFTLHSSQWDFQINLTKLEGIEIINQLTLAMGISFQIATEKEDG